MKHRLYIFCCICSLAGLFPAKSHAQYTITGWGILTSTVTATCDTVQAFNAALTGSGPVTGLLLKTYFGDGSSRIDTIFSTGSTTAVAFTSHVYHGNGNYTVKYVLLNGSSPVDSMWFSYYHTLCSNMKIQTYIDSNSNCSFDAGDGAISFASSIGIDSSGIPIDTVDCINGLSYEALGPPGTVYGFRILSPPANLVMTCPSGGVIYDTVPPLPNDVMPAKFFGFECSTSSGFDLMEIVAARAGRHAFSAQIINNAYCTPATLVMTCSPKYDYVSAYPPPTTVSGNTLTWNLTGSPSTPLYIDVHFEVPGTWLIPGDTVHSSYVISPTSGDADPTNNIIYRVDTVKASWDPNHKSVSPAGNIIAGTLLEYKVQFENMGNDVATNIHVLDTLSPNVDIETLKIIAASAKMDLTVLHAGGSTILNFDFPNINLLDSSHHGECDGMVVYTIKSKSGLSPGTTIDNRAGIYFDENEVVMTNTVQNTIPFPAHALSAPNVSATKLYPNPVTDELTIKTENNAYSTATITNIIGQEVISQPLDGPQTKVNVKALPAGIYYVTLSGADGVRVEKFVK
jgi:uncharacterized repeat protein (TIGR01451 family)